MTIVDTSSSLLALNRPNVVLPEITKELHLPLLAVLGDTSVRGASQALRQLLLESTLKHDSS